MTQCIMVGLGGFVGAVCRYLFGLIPLGTDRFPLGTFLINLVGAVLIGAISAVWELNPHFDRNILLLLTVGLCGGFTTFSTFTLESLGLIEKGRVGAAAAYMLLSVSFCLLGVMIGRGAVRAIL
ncbi:fluoride efflux transporter CrcB [Papillibacter cinnamivorans]|uniref:Fluoride-specific ion channel FluC n=1 Tax=Papillibacter cinnamivorans DSM 12816 TaxID=1122930 RepID=A0A1W1ZK51_9FIRM|nr:fluoride efflux transporter CrcB [Papillibacter cinnamivorans]SMC48431.1 CrcB protein [Papillibacter cinnamivorans DSM 12816]